MKSNAFKLDPRTKLILVIVANIAMLSSIPKWLEIGVVLFFVLLLLLFKKNTSAIKFLLVFFLMIAGEEFLMLHISRGLQAILGVFVVMFRRFIPCILIGYIIINTTTVSEFVAAMEKLHISKKIIIPFSVMFRFFPTVKEEWNAIKDAMRMRGIGVSYKSIILSPISTLEYMLVPLLSSAVKTGDELSAASLARGLDGTVKRTNICKIGFFAYDYLVITISFVFISLAILVGKVIV